MEIATFKQSPIPEILRVRPAAVDTFMLCDMGGLVEKARSTRGHTLHMSWTDAVSLLERGNPKLTDKADAFMSKFEDDIFLGQGWNTTDEVVGALPNVPAYLAGHPQNMRLRRKITANRGTLCVFFELTGSSGSLNSRHERGAAMLALIRLLTNTRPVEFWTLTTLGMRNTMNMVACRMDTTPLDVARSAAMLMDNTCLEVTCEVNRRLLGGGSWSYGEMELERKWTGEALRRVIQPSSEILFIPATYLSDNMWSPEQWVRDMLKKYGMSAVQQED